MGWIRRWFGARGRGRWASMHHEHEVERVLREALPAGVGLDQVRAYARAEGLECSDLIEGKVYCSAPAPAAHVLVAAKWLIVFSFQDGRLARTEVSRGLTGP